LQSKNIKFPFRILALEDMMSGIKSMIHEMCIDLLPRRPLTGGDEVENTLELESQPPTNASPSLPLSLIAGPITPIVLEEAPFSMQDCHLHLKLENIVETYYTGGLLLLCA
jgi:hypothetical protein